jgi:pimeloyl-ACP methyl ester carboxylesterase
MKQQTGKKFLAFTILILLIILLGPFLIPVPPLAGLLPPEALADPDSQFIQINGLNVHVKTMGQGDPAIVLLHGFGANLNSWQAVMEPLSKYGRVIAFDRPAFGLTERPLQWNGLNPYSPDAQIELVNGILNHFEVQQAILVGNSAGGTISMRYFLKYPERVAALVLVDPAVYNGGGAPAWIRPLFSTPQVRHLGPLLARQLQSSGSDLLNQAWHDPSRLTTETKEQYQKPLQVENWDKALWEFTLASQSSDLPEHLTEFFLPVLVITGDDDRIVPTEESVRLASELPKARLVVIQNAGHVPHEERPAAFMDSVGEFLARFVKQ